MKAIVAITALLGCHADALPPAASPSQPSQLSVPAAPAPVDRATVRLDVVGNRPFIDLSFHKPDGSIRTARFLVDTGGGAFLITEPLAHEAGITWGAVEQEEGRSFGAVTTPPDVSVGAVPLDFHNANVAVLIGADTVLRPQAPGHADGMLPGRVLSRYHVVFDYPNATFTIAKAGVLVPQGDASPMPVSDASGFPRTELEVDGTKLGFLLDTGASFTMVSDALLKSWGSAHPEWERHPGAFGEAKTLGGQTLETMTVPAASWGAHALAGVGVTSQHEGVFEKWMSSMTAAPVVGSLAGNVLKRFRVELDYPNERLYLSGP